MKIILKLSVLVLLMAAAPKSPPRAISLGEIQIHGDVERPMVTFVIPRAQLELLESKAFLDKKNWMKEILESLNSDIFKVP